VAEDREGLSGLASLAGTPLEELHAAPEVASGISGMTPRGFS
jgi:hypothetical protein